jgi:hypothetical protein
MPFCTSVLLIHLSALKIEPRALFLLDKSYTTELHFRPVHAFYIKLSIIIMIVNHMLSC